MAEEAEQQQQPPTAETTTAPVVSASTTAATTTASTPPTGPSGQRRHLPQVLVAKMLTMILQNGVAIATRQARPNSVVSLNAFRTELLLHCTFFDPAHKPEELSPRTRRPQVSFTDIVVLMARLLRVLMKQATLTEEEERERVEVRNQCLDQPFFDRALVGSTRPFVNEDGFMDEGCVV